MEIINFTFKTKMKHPALTSTCKTYYDDEYFYGNRFEAEQRKDAPEDLYSDRAGADQQDDPTNWLRAQYVAKSVQIAKLKKSERYLNNYLSAKISGEMTRSQTAERNFAQKNEQLALLLKTSNHQVKVVPQINRYLDPQSRSQTNFKPGSRLTADQHSNYLPNFR